MIKICNIIFEYPQKHFCSVRLCRAYSKTKIYSKLSLHYIKALAIAKVRHVSFFWGGGGYVKVTFKVSHVWHIVVRRNMENIKLFLGGGAKKDDKSI